MKKYPLFISCPKDLEYLLSDELQSLGLTIEKVSPNGVYLQTDLSGIYQICLWSRLANRLQLILFSGQAYNVQTLSQLCQQFHWQTIFGVAKTLAISFHGTSQHIENTMYGAQLIKDAIVDHFRQLHGSRPTIDKNNPDILLHAYLKNDNLIVSLDLAGFSLHQRGYRAIAARAPLKENLAAALLMRAQWPARAAQGYGFYDPCCGSGTLVIEAAMMAAHIAPGLLREDQHLIHWNDHNPALWEIARQAALRQVKPVSISIAGCDHDPKAIMIAKENAKRAGVHALVDFHMQDLSNARPQEPHGVLLCNPPYGERIDDPKSLIPLYQNIGKLLADHFQGWHAGIITSNPLLAKAIGLRSDKQYACHNGPIPCKLYCFSIHEDNQLKHGQTTQSFSGGAQMFANRLAKNFQHLQKWAKRLNIHAWRLYDADLPEYACAIDIYNDSVVMQMYKAPASIPAHKAEKRALEMIQVIYAVLNVPPERLVIKERSQQKGSSQYQKLSENKKEILVREGDAQFKVNLHDYLDTGLFPDHRLLRLRFGKLPPNIRFLNCYCYTATASVHAALAGAVTTNVDLSKTYLQWAADNFRLNHLNLKQHQFIHADCREWLTHCRDRFDVIFLDPPSFSNSKRMSTTLDIQRDHVELIDLAMHCLIQTGELYFSTNLRQFKLSPLMNEKYQVKNITKQTIDEDFKNDQRIHQCYVIRHK